MASYPKYIPFSTRACRRSAPLSYASDMGLIVVLSSTAGLIQTYYALTMVPATGIEPMTSSLPTFLRVHDHGKQQGHSGAHGGQGGSHKLMISQFPISIAI